MNHATFPTLSNIRIYHNTLRNVNVLWQTVYFVAQFVHVLFDYSVDVATFDFSRIVLNFS